MSVSMLNRMLVAAAVISAVSLVGTSVPAYAQHNAQQGQKEQGQKQQGQKQQGQKKQQGAEKQQQQPTPQARQQQGQAQPRQMHAGRADRQDRRAFNYRTSYAYRDGNYGYGCFYIERDTYNYYFRQGFRRGYEDGYYGRSRYGVYSTGRYAVRAPALTVIINLRSLR